MLSTFKQQQQQGGEKQQSTDRVKGDTSKRVSTASADAGAGPSIVPAITNAGEGGGEMHSDDMVVPVGSEGEGDDEVRACVNSVWSLVSKAHGDVTSTATEKLCCYCSPDQKHEETTAVVAGTGSNVPRAV